MTGIEIVRLAPLSPPPAEIGAVIVTESLVGRFEVRHVAETGSELIHWSTLSFGSDLRRVVGWAVVWAKSRGLPRIYVDSHLERLNPDGWVCSDSTPHHLTSGRRMQWGGLPLLLEDLQQRTLDRFFQTRDGR